MGERITIARERARKRVRFARLPFAVVLIAPEWSAWIMHLMTATARAASNAVAAPCTSRLYRNYSTGRRHGGIGNLLAAGGLIAAVALSMALTITASAGAPFAAATRTTSPRFSNSPSPTEACWVIVPNLSQASVLYGVTAVSTNDVWAVGEYLDTDTNRTLVERWDGTAWTVVPSPSPGTINWLFGVAAVSANDVWTVGVMSDGPGSQTLVERWDGTAWSVVPSANGGACQQTHCSE